MKLTRYGYTIPCVLAPKASWSHKKCICEFGSFPFTALHAMLKCIDIQLDDNLDSGADIMTPRVMAVLPYPTWTENSNTHLLMEQ